VIQEQRQREIRAQKAAVTALRREIGLVDHNARRTYIRDFHKDFSSFQERASYDDLIVRGFRSDIIYIGDYHALPRCQEFAARFLADMIQRSSSVVLGVEMVYGRQQHILDEWLARSIEDEELLRRLRYDQEWGYDWAAYRKVMETARSAGVPVVGLDREPRTGFRLIRKRDTYASGRIAEVFARTPDAKVVVLVGESHLARRHLPGRVARALGKQQMEKRSLVIVQNIDALYWQRAEEGMDDSDVVRLDTNRYCVFNATPLAKYEAYRQVLETWRDAGGDDDVDLAPTVHSMIETLLAFLRIDGDRPIFTDHNGAKLALPDLLPEVYAGEETEFVEEMMARHGLDEESRDQILGHLARAGSCYVPRINAIFVGTFDLTHAGEEASHFVNFALRGEIYEAWETGARPAHHRFYDAVLDEAIGYFGSKLIDPARNHFFETDFYRHHGSDPREVEARTGYSYADFRAIIDFILLHKKFERDFAERNEIPPAILEGIGSRGDRQRILTHELGYFLGQQIHDGYQKGLVSHAEILALYGRRREADDEPLAEYLDWVEKLKPLGGG
jgi:hypothetical protein